MSELIFDTHAYVKKLRSAGVPEEQAEIHAETIAQLVDDRLVSKQYLDFRLAELKTDIIKWIIGISAAQAALIVAMIKLIK